MSTELLTRSPELTEFDLVEHVGFMALEETVDLNETLATVPAASTFSSSLSSTFSSSLAASGTFSSSLA